MKRLLTTSWLLAGLMIIGHLEKGVAQETRFYRVAGPVITTISGVTSGGFITWSNIPTNTTFTIQTTTSLSGISNWVDWVQVPTSNSQTIWRIFDSHPPSGMSLIPAGVFTMGNSFTGEGQNYELPLHSVYVSEFYIDKFEVTKTLWDEVYSWAVTNGYSFTNDTSGVMPNHPIRAVSWFDAVKWCNARSEMEGLSPCYYTDASQIIIYRSNNLNLTNAAVKWMANGYRLPTEAEWEKAARGGLNGRRFPWGDTITHSNANYYARPSNYPYDVNLTTGSHITYGFSACPVGLFPANGYGLHDTSGNIYEWVWDWFDSAWYGNPNASQDDSHGPIVTSPFIRRVLRGGDYSNYANAVGVRCAQRSFSEPDYKSTWVGFRTARRPF